MIALVIGMCIAWADPVTQEVSTGTITYIDQKRDLVWILPDRSKFNYALARPDTLSECQKDSAQAPDDRTPPHQVSPPSLKGTP